MDLYGDLRFRFSVFGPHSAKTYGDLRLPLWRGMAWQRAATVRHAWHGKEQQRRGMPGHNGNHDVDRQNCGVYVMVSSRYTRQNFLPMKQRVASQMKERLVLPIKRQPLFQRLMSARGGPISACHASPRSSRRQDRHYTSPFFSTQYSLP